MQFEKMLLALYVSDEARNGAFTIPCWYGKEELTRGWKIKHDHTGEKTGVQKKKHIEKTHLIASISISLVEHLSLTNNVRH